MCLRRLHVSTCSMARRSEVVLKTFPLIAQLSGVAHRQKERTTYVYSCTPSSLQGSDNIKIEQVSIGHPFTLRGRRPPGDGRPGGRHPPPGGLSQSVHDIILHKFLRGMRNCASPPAAARPRSNRISCGAYFQPGSNSQFDRWSAP